MKQFRRDLGMRRPASPALARRPVGTASCGRPATIRADSGAEGTRFQEDTRCGQDGAAARSRGRSPARKRRAPRACGPANLTPSTMPSDGTSSPKSETRDWDRAGGTTAAPAGNGDGGDQRGHAEAPARPGRVRRLSRRDDVALPGLAGAAKDILDRDVAVTAGRGLAAGEVIESRGRRRDDGSLRFGNSRLAQFPGVEDREQRLTSPACGLAPRCRSWAAAMAEPREGGAGARRRAGGTRRGSLDRRTCGTVTG